MSDPNNLKIKIFLDGANEEDMLSAYGNPLVKGFTTNPSLMRKAGVEDYEAFARGMVAKMPDRSISFEVFADDPVEMERQAMKITTWGENVYVKIPITNTKSESTVPLIKKLRGEGVKINITAMMTVDQVRELIHGMGDGPSSYVSVYAGRLGDRGWDPIPMMTECLEITKQRDGAELLWASTRQVYNIVEADRMGCHIITVPGGMIKQLSHFGADMTAHSLDTVQAFYDDATASGFDL